MYLNWPVRVVEGLRVRSGNVEMCRSGVGGVTGDA